jgi:hypothetical protein
MLVKLWIVVSWVMMLCRLLGGYQHFGGMYLLHVHHTEDGGNKFLQNAGNHLQDYMVSWPKRPQFWNLINYNCLISKLIYKYR